MALKVVVWNAHSVKNKSLELSFLIQNLNVDIILLNETWLAEDDIFSIPNYVTYRSDRARGGTAILVKS